MKFQVWKSTNLKREDRKTGKTKLKESSIIDQVFSSLLPIPFTKASAHPHVQPPSKSTDKFVIQNKKQLNRTY